MTHRGAGPSLLEGPSVPIVCSVATQVSTELTLTVKLSQWCNRRTGKCFSPNHNSGSSLLPLSLQALCKLSSTL